MTTFLVTLAVFVVALAAMALGVVVTGRRLRGSCGLGPDDCACSALRALRCSRRQE